MNRLAELHAAHRVDGCPAFDLGCIECGQPSAVLGVFMSRDEANLAAEHAKRVQRENWLGQHYFEVYEIEVPS